MISGGSSSVDDSEEVERRSTAGVPGGPFGTGVGCTVAIFRLLFVVSRLSSHVYNLWQLQITRNCLLYANKPDGLFSCPCSVVVVLL